MFQINPHLWLRLAECCIMAYREVSGKALPAFECLIEAVQMFQINGWQNVVLWHIER